MFLIEPLALAVNLQAGAVDKQMQWLRAVNPLRQNRQAATAPAQESGPDDVETLVSRWRYNSLSSWRTAGVKALEVVAAEVAPKSGVGGRQG